MNGISGVVICFNEEERIGRCLESLRFCDEIIVVDSHSTDATREIAARHADQVITQDFLGYVKQRNFALEQAKRDWVVCLDADEALDPECQAAIRAAVSLDDGSVAGYVLNRLTFHLGVWHHKGEYWPDRELRVFRRGRGRSEGREPHDRIVVDGPVRQLPGRLLHWAYLDLAEQVRQIDRFSSAAAASLHESGRRFRVRDLLVRPLYRFVKGYLLRGGFLLGLPGFLVSVSSAYYVFMKYAKLWELSRRPPST